MPKKSGFIKVLSFICFLLIVLIIYCFLDIAEIIEVDEKYSLKDYIFEEVDYNETVENESLEVISEINRDEIEEINTNVILENVEAPIFSENVTENKVEEEKVYDETKGMQDCYYYNQLDYNGKIIYARLTNEYDNLKTGTYKVDFEKQFNDVLQTEEGKVQIENSFQAALNAILFDRPEFFFIQPNKFYLYTQMIQRGSKITYLTYLGPAEGENYLKEGFENENDVNNALKLFEKSTEDIVRSAGNSSYEIVKYAHDWLVENVTYDQSVSLDNIYDIYGVFNNGKAVCAGYAHAFKYILDRAGLPCIYITGEGINDGKIESHAWNYVYIGNAWYLVDCTWDDPIITGGIDLSSKIRDTYFLKGKNATKETHIAKYENYGDIKFSIPELNTLDYRKR